MRDVQPLIIYITYFVPHFASYSVHTVSSLHRIPGRLNDRRTPLGELNWIFTAVTDTIAWNTLPRGRTETENFCLSGQILLLILQFLMKPCILQESSPNNRELKQRWQ